MRQAGLIMSGLLFFAHKSEIIEKANFITIFAEILYHIGNQCQDANPIND